MLVPREAPLPNAWMKKKMYLKSSYANAPGLIEAFEKSGLSHESYLTGQCAFIFTKMLVNDVIQHKGAIAPEVLNAAERKYFFNEAQKLDITIDRIIE